jgi:hypothetical protein
MKTWAKQLFYPEVYNADPSNSNPLPVGSAAYAAGDARLDCFLDGYRYDQATGLESIPTCTDVGTPAQVVAASGQGHVWPMFSTGLPDDPRFGVIPVLQSWVSGSSNASPIVGFWAEFAYRLYTSSTKVEAVDAWVFDPALIATVSGTPGLQFGYQTDPVVHLVE